jgi:hypothetical protein
VASSIFRGGTRGDLGKCLTRGLFQRDIAAPCRKPETKDHGICLVLGEHQWWQKEARIEHAAGSWRPLDSSALSNEGRHVAIDGAERHAQLVGKTVRRYGSSPSA